MERLPQEILDVILSLLDAKPPSERHLFDKPSIQFFHCDLQPLKCISLTNSSFRRLTAKLLFKHIVMDARRDLSGLLSTLRNLEIRTNQVHSILIHNNPFANHPVSTHRTQRVLDMAMEMLNPPVVTLAISPTKLATIMRSTERLADAWVFQIPFQVLRLQTERRNSDVWQTPSHLLQARPWSQLTFNEGSSTPAYSTYEYFRHQVPTWITNPGYFEGCLQYLKVYEFIAVFPFANWNRLNILSAMTGLRILRVQLAPSVQNPSADEDDIREAKLIQDNHKDMWMEFQSFFEELANRIESDSSSLPLSTVDFLDYRNDALKGIIEEVVHNKMVSWTRRGECSWIKNINNSGSSSESAQT